MYYIRETLSSLEHCGFIPEKNTNSVMYLSQHKCYILATVDRDLKRRIRKIPGVPIMYISNHRSELTSDYQWVICGYRCVFIASLSLSHIKCLIP